MAAQELGVEAYLSAVDKNFQSAMNMAVQSLTEVANANQSMATRSNSANASTEASSHRLTSGFMSMVTAMGAVAVAAKAFDVVKNAIGGAVARYDTLNNSARTFNNMGFGAKEVGSAMNGLKQSILGLPTPLDQAVKGVQMIAASTGDLGQSQKVYSALNDSIIGFGGSTADVNNAVIQLSQAFANGKVDGMTWISMMNSNMGPVLNAIAKKMGITTAALKDGLSSGKISVQDFQNALIDLDKNGGGGLKSLHNIALDATSGISTSIENAKTAMVRGLTDVLKSTDKALKSNDLPTISQMIVSAGNSISSAFSKIAAAMPKVISAIAPVLKALQPMAPVLKAVAAGFIALGVVALLAPRIAPVITVFGALFGVLKKTTGLFGGLGSRIGGLFKKLTGIGYAGKHAGGGLTEAGEGSKKAGKGASMSAPQILSMGAAIMMAAVGAAILVASFALLVSQVTKLAKVGPMGAIAFLAVAAGMSAVIGVMGIVGKMLGEMGPKAAIAYAGMALLVGAFALLTYAVTGLAQTGKQGTDALTTLTIAIVGIVAVMGIFAPVFQACIPGLLAFGAAIIMVGVGIGIAAAGLALLVVAFTGLVNAISGLASQGPVAIGVIIALTAGIAAMVVVLAVFGPLLTISAVGLLAFGAALLMAGVGIGIAAAGIAMLVNAISNLLSTNTVLGQIISDVWNGIKTVISEVANTVGPIVSAGFGAMKGIATGIMNALKGVISGVWNAIKGFFQAGVNFIKSVMHVDLSGNGRSIMQSLWDGMKSIWEGIKGFVSGIAGWIKAHKGPISYDRKLLIPAGQAIMTGFNKGLTDGFANVQDNVLSMASAIQQAATLPALNDNEFMRSVNAVQNRMQNMSASVDGTLTADNAGMTNLSSRLWRSRMEELVGVAVDKLDNVDQHPMIGFDTANRLNDYNNKVNAQNLIMWKE